MVFADDPVSSVKVPFSESGGKKKLDHKKLTGFFHYLDAQLPVKLQWAIGQAFITVQCHDNSCLKSRLL